MYGDSKRNDINIFQKLLYPLENCLDPDQMASDEANQKPAGQISHCFYPRYQYIFKIYKHIAYRTFAE